MSPTVIFVGLVLLGAMIVSFGYSGYYANRGDSSASITAAFLGVGAFFAALVLWWVGSTLAESKALTIKCLEDNGKPVFSGRDQIYVDCAYPKKGAK